MPAPLIPNGVYKIRSCGSPDRVVDLLNGNPYGEIVGRINKGSVTDEWLIENVGVGGNQVTIESLAAPGTYAHAHHIGRGRIVPSREKTVWTIVKVDGGCFYIQTQNGQRVWELPGGPQIVPILLVLHTGKDNTKWRFELLED